VKKIFSVLLALVLVVSLGLVTAAPVLADGTGTLIDVPDDYDTIQEAIDAASDGDTIMVAAGEYDAFEVWGKENISIISTEGATVTTADYILLAGILSMATVHLSENINIEGINIDGTDVNWTDIQQVAAGMDHTVGLKSDGTVVAMGNNDYGQCDVDEWTNIHSVAAGAYHTVGLNHDGTVVAVGDNDDGQCDVDEWTDIQQVAAGWWHTVGLEPYGTVVAVGDNDDGQCDVDEWTDIDQVAAGGFHTVGPSYPEEWYHTGGLGSDDVVAVGLNDDGQCNVDEWTDIDEVAAGGLHTVGLEDGGTVVAVGDNVDEQCDVDEWTNIDQVAAGGWHTVGLESDGTVVATGDNDYGQCDVDEWTNIDQVAAGGSHTVGLKTDGTVVAVGDNYYGQCGATLAAGIVYLDSTGGIADLTVENMIGTAAEATAGVAIVSLFGTSVADLSGATVENSGVGIYVSYATLEAHFSNIAGNDWYGLYAEGSATVDATYNWWGDASGPYHETLNPDGMGDEVYFDGEASVDFEPWLETEAVSDTVTDDTVDATEEADTEVVVDGTATVTVAQYDDNPGGSDPTGFSSLDKYIDVYVPDTTQVTELEIRLYYTDAELAAAGIDDFEDEELLRLLWWDGDEWDECSDSGVYTGMIIEGGYSGYMWAKIRDDTTPSLDDMQGTAFGGYKGPPETPSGGCFIATTAYGTDTAKEIDILREFRDEVLLPNSLGAEFISLYYKTSPPIANFISQHEVLRTAVRVGFVDPIVAILNWSHDLWSERGL